MMFRKRQTLLPLTLFSLFLLSALISDTAYASPDSRESPTDYLQEMVLGLDETGSMTLDAVTQQTGLLPEMSATFDLAPSAGLRDLEVNFEGNRDVRVRFLIGRPHEPSGDIFRLVSGAARAPSEPAFIFERNRDGLGLTAQYVRNVPMDDAVGDLIHVRGLLGDSIMLTALKHNGSKQREPWQDIAAIECSGRVLNLSLRGAAAYSIGTLTPQSAEPQSAQARAFIISSSFGNLDWSLSGYRLDQGFKSFSSRASPYRAGTMGGTASLRWRPRGWLLKTDFSLGSEITLGEQYNSLEFDVRRYLLPGKAYTRFRSNDNGVKWYFGLERGQFAVEANYRGLKLRFWTKNRIVDASARLDLYEKASLTLDASFWRLKGRVKLKETSSGPVAADYWVEYSIPLGK